jgi:hypothetical protein
MGEQPEFNIAEAWAAIAEAEKQLESDIPCRAELGAAVAELRADITNGESCRLLSDRLVEDAEPAWRH